MNWDAKNLYQGASFAFFPYLGCKTMITFVLSIKTIICQVVAVLYLPSSFCSR